ncbi:MAG: hypothetical protein JSS49_16925 [Planctomycetes bacterium]|nr:hypothetical protein [Planctomycetota bacterium]
MNRLLWLILGGTLFCSACTPVHAQFYGGYGYGFPGYGPGFGGYYPPYGYGGFGYGGFGYGGIGGFGFGNSINGMVPPPYGMPVSNPYVGYPGFGWWPLFASDVKVTAVPAHTSQQPSGAVPDGSSTSALQPQQTNPVASQVIHTGAEIKLICPKDVGKSLTYTLNGNPFTTQPGYSQQFRDDRTWKLEFQRGPDTAEVVSYTLKPGKYNFGIGSHGWELRQVIIVPTGELQPAPQPMPPETATPTPTPTSAPGKAPQA